MKKMTFFPVTWIFFKHSGI